MQIPLNFLVAVIAFHEEKKIERRFRPLNEGADEVIVVDSFFSNERVTRVYRDDLIVHKITARGYLGGNVLPDNFKK